MKIAVLSGKGGTGKTLTAVNLAVSAGEAVYIDCDVEEPNGRLFLQPEALQETDVTTVLPEFAPDLCTGCRTCVDFCRFHALVFIKDKPKVFPEVCHSCGGCALVCPAHAVKEKKKIIGKTETGYHGQVKTVTGILNTGEATGVPVIQKALEAGNRKDVPVIIDCPPGSACPVVESISEADYCLLVAEPTAFGFHNFRMVHELAVLLGKPCGVVMNKCGAAYEPLEAYCREKKLPVLLRIPYTEEIAYLVSSGRILAEEVPEYRQLFRKVLKQIGGEAL